MNDRRINIYSVQERDYFLELLVVILIVALALMTLYKPSEVSGASMEPQIHHEDIAVMVNKRVKRDNVVIVESAKSGTRIIKRVIGIPNDTIEFRTNGDYVDLYVNGNYTEEDYIKDRMLVNVFEAGASRFNWHARLDTPFTLESGQYYVCGDNRNISDDCRLIGPIKRNEILGVVVKVYDKDSFVAKLIKFIYNDDESEANGYMSFLKAMRGTIIKLNKLTAEANYGQNAY